MTNITNTPMSTTSAAPAPNPIPVTPASTTAVSGLASIAQSSQAIAGIIGRTNQVKVLGALQNEAGDVLSGAGQYNTRVNQIVTAMQNASPELYTKLSGELQTIRNGEATGVYTPSSAVMRLNNIAKQYSIRNPRLAPEIRQYISTYTGEVGKVYQEGQDDPLIKGFNAVGTAAASVHMSVPEYTAYLDAKNRNDATDAKLHEMTTNGDLLQSDTFNTFMNRTLPDYASGKAEGLMSALAGNFNASVANGTFDTNKWTNELTQANLYVRDQFMSTMLKAQKDSGLLFDTAKLEQQLKIVQQPINDLLTASKGLDSADDRLKLSNAFVAMTKNNDFLAIHKRFGAFGSLIASSADGVSAFAKVGSMLDQIKSGQGGSIRALSDMDPSTRMFLDVARETGALDQYLPQGVADVLSGKPKGENSLDNQPDVVGILADKVSVDVLTGNSKIDQQAATLNNVLKSNRPLSAIAANITALAPVLRFSSTARNIIDTRFQNGLNSIIANGTVQGISDLKWDGKMFTYEGPKASASVTPYNFDKPPDTYNDPKYWNGGQAAADYLNTYVKIISAYKSPAEISKEVGDAHKALLTTKATAIQSEYQRALGNNTYTINTTSNQIERNGKPITKAEWGTISKPEAAVIQNWLQRVHPDIADKVFGNVTKPTANAGTHPANSPWDNPLDKNVPNDIVNPVADNASAVAAN
jgi:hypothetical protein